MARDAHRPRPLAERRRGTEAPGAHGSGAEALLVCGQVALSLVLLTVTVFMYRAFQLAPGCKAPGSARKACSSRASIPALARYDDARTQTFFRDLKDRAAALPGVRSVALASTVPMRTDNLQGSQVAPEGFSFAPGIESINCPIGAGGRRLLRYDRHPHRGGPRLPSDRRRGLPRRRRSSTSASPPTTGPDRARSASGCRCAATSPRIVEIVGVAADSRYFFIVEPPLEFMYLPHAQSPVSRRSLMLASTGSATALADPLRAMVRSIDPQMPVLGLRTMEDYYALASHPRQPVDRGNGRRHGSDRRPARRGRSLRARGLLGEPPHA